LEDREIARHIRRVKELLKQCKELLEKQQVFIDELRRVEKPASPPASHILSLDPSKLGLTFCGQFKAYALRPDAPLIPTI